MPKHELLKFPNDFEGNLRALAIPPAPAGTAGGRKAAPRPPAKLKPRAKRYKPKGAAPHTGTFAYESAPVLKAGKRAKKRGGQEAVNACLPPWRPSASPRTRPGEAQREQTKDEHAMDFDQFCFSGVTCVTSVGSRLLTFQTCAHSGQAK